MVAGFPRGGADHLALSVSPCSILVRSERNGGCGEDPVAATGENTSFWAGSSGGWLVALDTGSRHFAGSGVASEIADHCKNRNMVASVVTIVSWYGPSLLGRPKVPASACSLTNAALAANATSGINIDVPPTLPGQAPGKVVKDSLHSRATPSETHPAHDSRAGTHHRGAPCQPGMATTASDRKPPGGTAVAQAGADKTASC